MFTDISSPYLIIWTFLLYTLLCYFAIQLIDHQKKNASIAFLAIIALSLIIAPAIIFMIITVTTIPLWYLLHKPAKDKEM